MAAQSITGIANRALQIVGAQAIMNLTDDSREARSANRCYDFCRRAELTAHRWRFGIKRVQLAASATAPPFEFAYAFPLPVDCLDVIFPNDYDVDWQVEGRFILTNSPSSPWSADLADPTTGGPVLGLRYKADITDPAQFDALFSELLSQSMALQMVQELTQSNQKEQAIQNTYKFALDRAAAANAFEALPIDAPEDPWIVDHWCANAAGY